MLYKFVKNYLIYLLLAVSFHAKAEAPDNISLNMVTTLQLGSNLSTFGKLAAFRTHTYTGIVKTLGPEKAEKIMKEELLRLLPKYQEQWDKNLAQSYLEYFSPSELDSIAKQQKRSPYINKLRSEQKNVGKRMQEKSNSVLMKFVTEAVQAADKRTATEQ